MSTTLEQLRTPTTKDQALATALEDLEALGFNVTSWHSGSAARTLVELFAATYAQLTNVIAALSRVGFNDTATGSALTALSVSHFQNTRHPAIATQGQITLTGGAIGPPHAITPGQLLLTSSDGVTFRNTSSGTINQNGTLVITVAAESAGSAGNVPNGSIQTLNTPLAGVSANNVAIAPSSTWITVIGSDEEPDESLRVRNSARWATLSPSDPASAYAYYVRTAVAGIARVLIDDANPDGPGTLRAYCASTSGPSGAADVAAAQTELDRIKNPTAGATALAAGAQSQDVVGTIYVSGSANTAATQAAVETAIESYVNGLPIGGSKFPPSLTGLLVHSELVGAITAVFGVERVELSAPASNVAVGPTSAISVGAKTLAYVTV